GPAADPAAVRAAERRRHSHRSPQARVQPRGLFRAVAAHPGGRRGADPRAAPLVARRAARPPGDAWPRDPCLSGRARAAAARARSPAGLAGVLELVAGVLPAAGPVYFV